MNREGGSQLRAPFSIGQAGFIELVWGGAKTRKGGGILPETTALAPRMGISAKTS